MLYYLLLLAAGALQGVMVSLNAQLGTYYSMFAICFFVHGIALILLLINLSPSKLAWLFTAVSCIGTGDWTLLWQLDYSYNVVWLCLSMPVSVAGFAVFGRIDIYDSPVIFRILENGGRKRLRVKKENKKTLHMRWRTVRNTMGNWALPFLIVLPLYAMTVYMIMNPYP